jgi:hypothetical protein
MCPLEHVTLEERIIHIFEKDGDGKVNWTVCQSNSGIL